MGSGLLIPALAAFSLVGAPPDGEAPARDDPVFRYSDREARAEAALEAFGPDEENCPNYAGSSVLVAPVVHREELVGYAFITPRLCLARGVSEFAVTRQMHFIFDRMVRAAHRAPMTLDADMSVDREATRAAMLAAAQEVAGADRVEGLQLLGGDVRALR